MRAAFLVASISLAAPREDAVQLSWQAEAFYDQSRFEAASAVYARVTPLLATEFGPDHLRTRIATNNHAAALLQLGRGADAESILRDVLLRRETTQSPDDETAAAAYNNLGEAFLLQEKISAAVQTHQRALDIRRQLSPDSAACAESLHNLGEALRRSGEQTRAAKLLEEATRLWRPSNSAPLMPGFAKSLNSLGLVLSAQGEMAHAERAFLEALHVSEQAYGMRHEIPASIHYNLAAHYQKERNWTLAEHHCRSALNVYELLPGYNDPKLAIMLEMHAQILSHLAGRSGEAKGQRGRARAIRSLQ